MTARIRMGMAGGGHGAFIGAVHRMAAAMDGQVELVCGALSSTPEKSRASARELGLPESRSYGGWQEMMAAEAKLPAGQRMHFVTIVTPNDSHFEIAAAALQAGFHVMCEKPVCVSARQALELKSLVQATQRLFCVAHTYTGYPLIKQARQMVAEGKLGKVRKVVAEYSQGWLTRSIEDNKQAEWRGDPQRAGIAGCMGDIGTHAANLAEYVSGARILAVNAELTTFVEGRRLDDDGIVILRMERGIKGLIQATQIATGEENDIVLKVFGEDGSLEWRQQEPNSLIARWLNAPMQVLRAGNLLGPLAMANTRTPSGHPEGYIEAFANLYRNFANAIRAHERGESPSGAAADYPGIDDGVRSMQFVEAVVANSASTQKWSGV